MTQGFNACEIVAERISEESEMRKSEKMHHLNGVLVVCHKDQIA